jgi:hypothetical protein
VPLSINNTSVISWYTIKPVFWGHPWDEEKLPYKTDDLLKEVKFIWNFLWQDKKSWPFNTGDCLIEVTAWAGLTVILLVEEIRVTSKN